MRQQQCETCGTYLGEFNRNEPSSRWCYVCDGKITRVGPTDTAHYVVCGERVYVDRERARDNIVWSLAPGTRIWPIYHGAPPSHDSMSWMCLHAGGSQISHIRHWAVTNRQTLIRDDNLHEFRYAMGKSLVYTDQNLVIQLRADGLMAPATKKPVTFDLDLYAVEFRSPQLAVDGWVTGFLVHSENLIASDVEFEDISIDE